MGQAQANARVLAVKLGRRRWAPGQDQSVVRRAQRQPAGQASSRRGELKTEGRVGASRPSLPFLGARRRIEE